MTGFPVAGPAGVIDIAEAVTTARAVTENG